jgi:hypothetical protein
VRDVLMHAVLRQRIVLIPIACATLAVCADAAANDLSFTPPPNRVGQSAWIPLHHQQQEPNLCAPTSASIILDYFGDSISPREIKALTRNTQYTPEENFIDFSGTSFRDLIAGLALRGYAWREKSYSNDSRGLKRGLADVERSLDGGIPVMIETSLYYGHAYVVAGYSTHDRAVFIVDPAAENPGIRAVRFEVLGSVWHPSGSDLGRRAAVFPRRRTRASR